MAQQKKIPFVVQILFAMGLGALLGWVAGPQIAPLGKLGSALIQMVKALATPLLFLVLLDSFVSASIRGRSLALLIAICLINAVLAVFIGMGIANTLRPGDALRTALRNPQATTQIADQDLWSVVLGYFPSNLFEPFLKHSVPGAILLALLFGLALHAMKKEGKEIKGAIAAIRFATEWILHALHWVVKFSPIAVFAVVAQSVGELGFAPLWGLGGYVACTLLGMALQVAIVYQLWIRVFAKMPLKKFWKQARGPAGFSFGVNSSLATMPLTLESLDRLKVSPTAARLGAGLGTNFNNDGILLYEAMAVLIVAQAYGLELSWVAQLGLALSCVVTSFGVAGVPEAGVVALTLVLSSAGIPTEILPLLLTVDWIVARCRSATNVIGDFTVAIVLDKFRLTPQ